MSGVFDKVNVSDLIRDHLATLRSYRRGRLKRSDYLLFFAFPALAASVLVSAGLLVRPLVSQLVTVLSILAGLMFSLLLLIYESASKHPGLVTKRERLRKELLAEVHANTSFAILVSIVAALAALVPLLRPPTHALNYIGSAIVYYLVGVFLLTLLMILKRVRSLLRAELTEEARRHKDAAAS